MNDEINYAEDDLMAALRATIGNEVHLRVEGLQKARESVSRPLIEEVIFIPEAYRPEVYAGLNTSFEVGFAIGLLLAEAGPVAETAPWTA